MALYRNLGTQTSAKKKCFFAKNADRPNVKVNLPNIFDITIAEKKKIIKFRKIK